MKKYFVTLLALIISTGYLLAQNDNANLLAQSPDGKTVKLVWFLKNAPQDFSGFDIKRKDGLGEWQKLNKLPLLPGISQKKSLTDAETDATEITRIKEKLKTLLKSGKLQDYNYSTFVSKWKNNDKEIQELSQLAALDFDVSIICGFGYVDHSVSQKTDYQYGLFAHGSDKLLAKTTWNYGEIPDLNVVREITSRASSGKYGVHVIWNVNLAKLKTSYVAGFNVYKRGIRLNDQPITATNTADPSEFSWYDAGAKVSVADQYSISTESLFGIEGIIKSYTYNPADHPAEYKKALVTNISSLGFYYKDGMSIKWNFPKEYERFIKGFYIEKDNMPNGYVRTSDMISPDSRSYTDHSASTINGYIRIRILTLYNDKTVLPGVEKLYSYFPAVDPPQPQNIKATLIAENKKNLVRISWDGAISGDSITHHYKLYTADRENNKYFVISDKLPLKQPSFTYTIPVGVAATHKFCIAACTKQGVESVHSDTISIKAPSTELPSPTMHRSFVDGKSATIQWEYPSIPDLMGFRLYMNDTLIAGEALLRKNTTEFTTGELPSGAVCNFTLQALSENGVVSLPSSATTILMPTRKK